MQCTKSQIGSGEALRASPRTNPHHRIIKYDGWLESLALQRHHHMHNHNPTCIIYKEKELHLQCKPLEEVGVVTAPDRMHG